MSQDEIHGPCEDLLPYDWLQRRAMLIRTNAMQDQNYMSVVLVVHHRE